MGGPGIAAAGLLGAAAGTLAWAVRAPAATLLAPSVHRGPRHRRAIALTFDDGPSESTPALLDLLDRHGARATFFAIGRNVERLPAIARGIAARGHELANHSYSHSPLYLRAPRFIRSEIHLAQAAIENTTGASPVFFRAPYGARWFGLRRAQAEHRLLGLMWTAIGLDWKLPGPLVARRLLERAECGAIFCLHDGRELQAKPDITSTLDALALLLPELRAKGYDLVTASQLLCPKTP